MTSAVRCCHLHEVLVDVLEALSLLGQLLDDVTAAEHGLHVHPHALNHQPLLQKLTDGAQLADPSLDVFSEGRAVPVAGHAAQRHLAVLQLLHQLCCLACLQSASS